MLILFMFIASVLADIKEDILPKIRLTSSQLNRSIIVTSTEPELLENFEKVLKSNPSLPYKTDQIAKIGDMQVEAERLLRKHSLPCLFLVSTEIVAEKKQYTITEFGQCKPSENLQMYIKNADGKNALWQVYDQYDKKVDVHSFANICNDYPLQGRLYQEEQHLIQTQKWIKWSSITLATLSIFPLSNQDPGFSSSEQARFWSSAFLLGSAAMLHYNRDVPAAYLKSQRSSLSNYYSQEQAQRIIDRRFPPKIEANTENTEDPTANLNALPAGENPNDTANESTENTAVEISPVPFDNSPQEPPSNLDNPDNSVESIPNNANPDKANVENANVEKASVEKEGEQP